MTAEAIVQPVEQEDMNKQRWLKILGIVLVGSPVYVGILCLMTNIPNTVIMFTAPVLFIGLNLAADNRWRSDSP